MAQRGFLIQYLKALSSLQFPSHRPIKPIKSSFPTKLGLGCVSPSWWGGEGRSGSRLPNQNPFEMADLGVWF